MRGIADEVLWGRAGLPATWEVVTQAGHLAHFRVSLHRVTSASPGPEAHGQDGILGPLPPRWEYLSLNILSPVVRKW